jgi:hypothetical protein
MLDVGSTLFERLDAALLCMRKLRCKDFKRQPRDPATNPPITAVHKEIYVVGRELVVPRVGGGRQWHGFRLLGSPAVLQTIARLLRSWKTSCPQSSHNQFLTTDSSVAGYHNERFGRTKLWLTGFGKSGFDVLQATCSAQSKKPAAPRETRLRGWACRTRTPKCRRKISL